jgi:hypothetical protein
VTFEPDQTVYLPDGRQAIYVLANGQDHLVRVLYEVEDGYDEPPYSYPSEKITKTREVYAKPPVEVWDKQVLAKREHVRELDRELADKRAEIRLAERSKTEMEKAAANYPCIQQALDFIEGRITHVVKWSGYGAVTIHTMPEAFEQIKSWGGRSTTEGMKLLSLFGTDERGRKVGWGLHEYRDGSGSGTTTIWPAKSEAEARAKVEELLNAALDAWRAGDTEHMRGVISINDTVKENPWLKAPDDWLRHQAELAAARKAGKIAKLREELAALEAAS